jgi:hypothetical protein
MTPMRSGRDRTIAVKAMLSAIHTRRMPCPRPPAAPSTATCRGNAFRDFNCGCIKSISPRRIRTLASLTTLAFGCERSCQNSDHAKMVVAFVRCNASSEAELRLGANGRVDATFAESADRAVPHMTRSNSYRCKRPLAKRRSAHAIRSRPSRSIITLLAQKNAVPGTSHCTSHSGQESRITPRCCASGRSAGTSSQ